MEGKKPTRVVRCWKRETLTPTLLAATLSLILRDMGLDRQRVLCHVIRVGEMFSLIDLDDSALYSATVNL